MFVIGSDQKQQSLQRTFHICIRPRFGLFGKAVSEEMIFQKSTNQKQELPVTAMFVKGSRRNEQSLQRTFQCCFLPRVGLLGQEVSEKTIFQKSTNQKQELHVTAMFVNGSYQVSVHWTKRFKWRNFLEIDQSETRIACGGHIFTESGRNEHSLQRTFQGCFLPNVGSFWENGFRGEDILKIDQSETRIACDGHVC